jgi:hypothetical protein
MLIYKTKIYFAIQLEPLNFFSYKKSQFNNEYLLDHSWIFLIILTLILIEYMNVLFIFIDKFISH